MRRASIILCLVALLAGCKSVERVWRNERKREMREIVAEQREANAVPRRAEIRAVVTTEVDAVIERKIGQLAVQYAPWALIPAGGAAGALWSKRRNGKTKNGDGTP